MQPQSASMRGPEIKDAHTHAYGAPWRAEPPTENAQHRTNNRPNCLPCDAQPSQHEEFEALPPPPSSQTPLKPELNSMDQQHAGSPDASLGHHAYSPWAARVCILLALLASGAALLVSSPSQAANEPIEPLAQPEAIVRFEPGASEAARDRAIAAIGGRVVDTIPALDAALVKAEAQGARDALATSRDASRAVRNVQANATARPDWSPNDRYFASEQWNLKRVGAPAAWDTARGGNVRLAVLDTGIQDGHPDLAGKVVLDTDFVDGDSTAQAVHPHGTHVASIAAAKTNNEYGIAGACPGCTIIDVRIADSKGASTAWRLAKGITYAANNGARAVNISMGFTENNATVRDAIDYAHERDALPVCSAGNDDKRLTAYYPASYANCLAVTSTNASDNPAADANRGPYVDVAAPGVGIIGAIPDAYTHYSGTSQAAPHAAGLAGLLAGEGYATSGAVKGRIQSTALDLGPDGRDETYGAGRIRFASAVAR